MRSFHRRERQVDERREWSCRALLCWHAGALRQLAVESSAWGMGRGGHMDESDIRFAAPSVLDRAVTSWLVLPLILKTVRFDRLDQRLVDIVSEADAQSVAGTAGGDGLVFQRNEKLE